MYFGIFKLDKRPSDILNELNKNKIDILAVYGISAIKLYLSKSEFDNISSLFSNLTDKPIRQKVSTSDSVLQNTIASWNNSFVPISKTDSEKTGSMNHPPVQFVSPIKIAELLASYKIITQKDVEDVKNYVPPSVKTPQMTEDFKNYYKKISDRVKSYEKQRRVVFNNTQRRLSDRTRIINNMRQTTRSMSKSIRKYRGEENIKVGAGIPRWLGDLIITVVADLPKKVADSLSDITEEIGKAIGALTGSSCKKMVGKIAAGVVFIESSIAGEPTFTTEEKVKLLANLFKGHQFLSDSQPDPKNLSWYYDFQYTKINVKGKEPGSVKYLSDNYFKDPAIAKINYNGKTFSGNTFGVNNYLEAIKNGKKCDTSIMYFITPFKATWVAYAIPYNGSITMSSVGNYGGWGIKNTYKVFAHETGHLFGAADEYKPGSGQFNDISEYVYDKWNGCDSTSGCNKTPNANFNACCKPGSVPCVMNKNNQSICYSSQGQIGWIDSYIKVEITTGSDWWSGTDSDVFIHFGGIQTELGLPWVNDFENGNTGTYYLWNSNITKDMLLDSFTIELRSVTGVGSDIIDLSIIDDWKLYNVKIYYLGNLVRNLTPNVWLKKPGLKWTAPKVSVTESTNFVTVEITTGTDWFSGTDNAIYLDLHTGGGKSYQLNTKGKNDFENGDTQKYVITDASLNKNQLSKFQITLKPYDLLVANVTDDWLLSKVKLWWNGELYANYTPNKWLNKNNLSWTCPL